MSQQWYLPYGKVRHAINTMPTQRTYTGQYTEAPGLGSLMFYNARYYSPALGRFVSADTLVPEPGNPQAFNRYSYVYNSPLKYTDPSGHDVMLVGGFTQDLYTDPAPWKEWIMTYKGWDEDAWNSYYEEWMLASNQNRQEIMRRTGVHYFRYGGAYYYSTTPAAEMVNELSRQLRGLHDITLVGYSKGANLVMNYLAALEAGANLTEVRKAVLIKAPRGNRVDAANGTPPGGAFSGGQCDGGPYGGATCANYTYTGNAQLVNIHATSDPIALDGPVAGAYNLVSDDNLLVGARAIPGTTHGMAPALAMAAFSALDVGGDHNAGLYALIPWSRR